VGTELFEALRAADPSAPPALDTFDQVVASEEPRPDFYEYSVHVGDRVSPHRLTYYFDTRRRGAIVAREAGERFLKLSERLGLAVPAPLADFVRSEAPLGDEVLQVVLGVDASPQTSALRGKYYLVFRDDPGRCVRRVLAAMGLDAPTGAAPEKVYIVGIDVAAAGVDDVKLYFRLEPTRVTAVIENHAEVASLLAACRDVVLLQWARHVERRQVYVHAESSVSLSGWLARHGYEEALGRARAVNAQMQGSRIEPRIVSMPYERGRVGIGQGNVYFHVMPGV
jgi:hypothetical protein